MKKISSIITILLIGLSIIGCNSKKEFDVKLKTTEVKGELSDYYTVVQGSYKLTTDGKETIEKGVYNYELKVQIKRTDNTFNFNPKDLESRGYFHITCDLLGADDSPHGKATDNSENASLATLKFGETGWAIFTIPCTKEEAEKIKFIQLNSDVDVSKDMQSYTNSENSTNDTTSTDNSTDCDQFITDYEEFVTDYIKVVKKYKANPTDTSILTEYSELAQKASEMQSKASDCTDPKYATKLMQLASKIAKAGM